MEKTNFDAFINAVGSEIQQAQVRLITAANAQMLFHYWKMGNYILYHQQLHGWGSKTIKQLAKAIRLNFPEKKGYSELLYVKPLDDGLVEIRISAVRRRNTVFSAMKDLGNLDHPKPLFMSSKMRSFPPRRL